MEKELLYFLNDLPIIVYCSSHLTSSCYDEQTFFIVGNFSYTWLQNVCYDQTEEMEEEKWELNTA